MGSFAETGIEMAERSLPTFLRRKPMRLGGAWTAGGIVVRRFTGETLERLSALVLVGNRLAMSSPSSQTDRHLHYRQSHSQKTLHVHQR